jgi:hypothetical protein
MLRNGEANPLTVHGLREMQTCPPHFIKVQFEVYNTNKKITDWIWEHLEGRFWVGDIFYKTEGGTVAMSSCAAFEIPGEASMFSLCLDQINHNQLY